ncbi:MAG: EAL domain-containing protein [Marinobacter sp.]|uniref:EAL domain-containing protein n=1 Tax=Marinobacter sp. TaxID=50741 RepID=UPI0034A0620D
MNKQATTLPDPSAMATVDAEEPVIAVMLSRAADRRVLTQLLRHPCIEPDTTTIAEAGFDLGIVDVQTLLRLEPEIRALRAGSAPALMPILLAASEPELKKANSLLGHLAEDVIRTPIRRIELIARVNNLLRLRQLSCTQKQETENTQSKLQGATRALHAFSSSNERVIHARNEHQMLRSICESLAQDAGYALAWVGKAGGQEGNRTIALAVAGPASECIHRIGSNPDSDLLSQGPVKQTLSSGTRHQVSGIADRSELSAWRQSAKAHQLHSVIVFPLTIRGNMPEACLAIYSTDTSGFARAEIELLQRMVDNIIHGIRSLREKYLRRRSEKKAHEMAYRDSLTGLANRTAAIEALDRHLRQVGPFPPAAGLLYLDLDGFKLINDALGHHAGDSVLIEVADRLRSVVRDSDLVARQGGDEFIILAPHEIGNSLSTIESGELKAAMARVAERILQVLKKPFDLQGREYHLGASIGISLCPGHACDASTLMMRADSAMYQAKSLGGSRYRFFSSELSQRQQHRLEMENRLYKAVEENQFKLVFQPLIDLATTSVVGVEALIRWPQPDGSSISPGQFIPIAEETGLIIQMGDWVMTESLEAIHRWRMQGFTHLQMSVNLSISQLWQPRLVAGIVEQLDSLGIPPKALKIELTEGAIMTDVFRMEGIIQEFREAGIPVAINDFGTGYSSLARLRSLPITTLKIDRSFLRDTPDDQTAVMMVNTITQMAESLGIEALAEGIETEAQWRMLQAMGCRYGQGFYFARPMAEAKLLRMLGAGS